MDTQGVDQLVKLVFGAFHFRPGAQTLALWHEELGKLQIAPALAEAAVRVLVFGKQGGSAPTLPEVVRAIKDHAERVERNNRPREERKEPTKAEALSIVGYWMAEAHKAIDGKVNGNRVPTAWGPKETLELHRRRKEARIPCGRDRWGKIGQPFGTDAYACAEALQDWLRKLPLTDDELRRDRAIIDEIEAERRAGLLRTAERQQWKQKETPGLKRVGAM